MGYFEGAMIALNQVQNQGALAGTTVNASSTPVGTVSLPSQSGIYLVEAIVKAWDGVALGGIWRLQQAVTCDGQGGYALVGTAATTLTNVVTGLLATSVAFTVTNGAIGVSATGPAAKSLTWNGRLQVIL